MGEIHERPVQPTSLGEEIANSVSHGLALAAALAGLPILAGSAIERGNAAEIVGACVFSATTVLLYLASTLYHALPTGRAKQVFRILDHSAIYLLIAGTYTPFMLGPLRGTWGWTLLATVWSLAIAGIVFKVAVGVRYPWLSTAFYLCMGWLVLVAVEPLLESVPAWGLFWLLAGGVAYTVGVAFFALERIAYSHLVWHVFVAVGTICHAIAVLRYAT